MVLHDIRNEVDIRFLVDQFYIQAKTDPLLAPVFNQWIGEDWSKHLPIMYSFWNNVLFHQGGYKGNPMQVHQRIHQKNPLSAKHFERWLALWTTTGRKHFAGPQVENLIERAESIAQIMQQKLD